MHLKCTHVKTLKCTAKMCSARLFFEFEIKLSIESFKMLIKMSVLIFTFIIFQVHVVNSEANFFDPGGLGDVLKGTSTLDACLFKIEKVTFSNCAFDRFTRYDHKCCTQKMFENCVKPTASRMCSGVNLSKFLNHLHNFMQLRSCQDGFHALSRKCWGSFWEVGSKLYSCLSKHQHIFESKCGKDARPRRDDIKGTCCRNFRRFDCMERVLKESKDTCTDSYSINNYLKAIREMDKEHFCSKYASPGACDEVKPEPTTRPEPKTTIPEPETKSTKRPPFTWPTIIPTRKPTTTTTEETTGPKDTTTPGIDITETTTLEERDAKPAETEKKAGKKTLMALFLGIAFFVIVLIIIAIVVAFVVLMSKNKAIDDDRKKVVLVEAKTAPKTTQKIAPQWGQKPKSDLPKSTLPPSKVNTKETLRTVKSDITYQSIL